MQLTLNVDSHQLSDEVKEILQNITPEQKQELAKDLLKTVIVDFQSELDKEYMTQKACDLLRKEYASSSYSKDKSDWPNAEIIKREKYDFERKFEKVTSFKRELLLETIQECVRYSKQLISEEIAKNEEIKAEIQKSIEAIKTTLPQIAQNAMTMYLTTQMQTALQETQQSLMNNSVLDHKLNEVVRKLNNG